MLERIRGDIRVMRKDSITLGRRTVLGQHCVDCLVRNNAGVITDCRNGNDPARVWDKYIQDFSGRLGVRIKALE
jgi:hypothetical protein